MRRGYVVNCERCGHPHTQKEWDELQKDWQIFFQNRKGYAMPKAFDYSHREMRKHGPRPKGPAKPPLWLRLGAGIAGEGENMKKFWSFLNGKKTLLGVIIVSVPVIWGGLEPVLTEAGLGAEKIAAVGGVILGGIGILHKVMKALGVAEKPPTT